MRELDNQNPAVHGGSIKARGCLTCRCGPGFVFIAATPPAAGQWCPLYAARKQVTR